MTTSIADAAVPAIAVVLWRRQFRESYDRLSCLSMGVERSPNQPSIG